MRAAISLLIVAALGAAGFYGYRAWNGHEPEATYRTAEVGRGTIVATVSATGTIEPVVKVLVGSQVSGTVTRWYADFNDEVKVGEVLLELDQDRYRATLDQRTAALAVAKARVEEAAARHKSAELNLEQTLRAFEHNAALEFEVRVVRAEVEAALAALHAAEAEAQAAEADRRFAEAELNKTIIRAPIDGVVISRDVDEGQTVAASLQAPTLFTIANDLRQMRVNANVSETDIGQVREGMSAEFRVDAYPDRRFKGVVSQVRYAETVVDNVVTYTTLIDVDNEDLSLRPGMTATILFEVAKAEDVLTVPNAALRFDPNAGDEEPTNWFRPMRGKGRPAQPRVYTLGAGGSLVEVPLQLGLTDGTSTQVVSGDVSVGDMVVTEKLALDTSGSGPRMPRGL